MGSFSRSSRDPRHRPSEASASDPIATKPGQRATDKPHRKPGDPRIGTVIIRKWRGVELRLYVRENGFALDGQLYRSLSAAAIPRDERRVAIYARRAVVDPSDPDPLGAQRRAVEASIEAQGGESWVVLPERLTATRGGAASPWTDRA